jgi:P27 family predicted phage terminase small subunit
MAGRPREPADLVRAKGKAHLSQRAYEEKKSSELDVPFTDVAPPKCLTTKKQKDEFNEIAKKLVALNIFTELDVDALARYIISKGLYLTYTKKLNAKLKEDDCDLRDINTLQQLQDKSYRQCVTSANELCLNISSRAKLVIPQPPDGDDDEL